jgi:hypothetical protein
MESSTRSKERIYDRVRNAWVVATPEEIVRQTLLNKMIDELLYPKELIVVEKALSEIPILSTTNAPLRRIDVACFAKNIHPDHMLYPLLLIECKESKQDAMEALEQVKGYNRFIRAYFIAVAYPGGELFGFLEKDQFSLLEFLPSYPQLIQAICHGY